MWKGNAFEKQPKAKKRMCLMRWIVQRKPPRGEFHFSFKYHRRAAKDLKNGMYVNLGIGMPTLLGQHLTWNIPKDAGSVSSNGDTDIA